MPLKFPGRWRFEPPVDGAFVNHIIPEEAIAEFIGLIMRVATQGKRKEILEHFKRYFCRAVGASYMFSSDVGWAETDLRTSADQAAQNPPLFIEAFYDACEAIQRDPDVFSPDIEIINGVLTRNRIGYEIRLPRLELREAASATPLVAVEVAPPMMAERVVDILARISDLKIGDKGAEDMHRLCSCVN